MQFSVVSLLYVFSGQATQPIISSTPNPAAQSTASSFKIIVTTHHHWLDMGLASYLRVVLTYICNHPRRWILSWELFSWSFLLTDTLCSCLLWSCSPTGTLHSHTWYTDLHEISSQPRTQLHNIASEWILLQSPYYPPAYTYSPMLHSVSVIAPVPAVVILDGQGVHRAWDSVSLYVFTGHGWQTSITSCFPAGHETVGNTLNIEKDVRLDYTGYIDSSHWEIRTQAIIFTIGAVWRGRLTLIAAGHWTRRTDGHWCHIHVLIHADRTWLTCQARILNTVISKSPRRTYRCKQLNSSNSLWSLG